MATYIELFNLFNDAELRNKVEVAVIIAANNLADTPGNNAFVSDAFNDTRTVAEQALMAVLAGNSASTVAQITGASDAVIQAAVDSVVTILVKAKAGL